MAEVSASKVNANLRGQSESNGETIVSAATEGVPCTNMATLSQT